MISNKLPILFNNWNNGNNVLKWDIKRFIENKNTIVVEWFFECEYNKKINSLTVFQLSDSRYVPKTLKIEDFLAPVRNYLLLNTHKNLKITIL